MWRGVAWFFVPWCVLLMTLQLSLTHLLGWSNLIVLLPLKLTVSRGMNQSVVWLEFNIKVHNKGTQFHLPLDIF